MHLCVGPNLNEASLFAEGFNLRAAPVNKDVPRNLVYKINVSLGPITKHQKTARGHDAVNLFKMVGRYIPKIGNMDAKHFI